MTDQLDFFESPPSWPEGFQYGRDLITREDEESLLQQIRELPFKEFEFHGFLGKRRTVSFGKTYDFAEEKLRPADDMPAFLLALRQKAAAFAQLPAEQLMQVLVTEYGENAGIGWHRDKGVFGDVVGISLLFSCRFRLRRKTGKQWERVSVLLEPRSAYLLHGPVRTEWEHSIPEVDAPRYSVTYRTIR